MVSHPKLTDIADYWWVAEDKILREPTIGRTVNIIVHTLAEVNQGLSRGEYFWTDIHRDGVILYEMPGHPLTTPRPPTVVEARDLAERYFETKSLEIDVWLEAASDVLTRGTDRVRRRNAAFQLHQAVEASYACFLLVHTFYFPRSHNIKFLRSLAEDGENSLALAWPRGDRADRRRFELLKRAYVEARYSDEFDVSEADLSAIMASATTLRDLVLSASRKRVEDLRAADR